MESVVKTTDNIWDFALDAEIVELMRDPDEKFREEMLVFLLEGRFVPFLLRTLNTDKIVRAVFKKYGDIYSKKYILSTLSSLRHLYPFSNSILYKYEKKFRLA